MTLLPPTCFCTISTARARQPSNCCVTSVIISVCLAYACVLISVIAQQPQKFSGIHSHLCSPQASRHSRALSQARPGGPGPHLHLSIERTRQEPGHCLGVRQGWRGCFQSQVPNHWTTDLSLDERLSLFLNIPLTCIITVQKLGSANLLCTAGQVF